MLSIIESVTSKITCAQSKMDSFLNGKTPTIEEIVEDAIVTEEANKKSITLEIDDDYFINSKSRLALLNPKCPIHGDKYITENGWTSNKLDTITGDKIEIKEFQTISKFQKA
jgi:hypothetical protein